MRQVDYSRQVGPGSETWKDISVIIKALNQVSGEAMADKKVCQCIVGLF
jgi:hypothetical protein